MHLDDQLTQLLYLERKISRNVGVLIIKHCLPGPCNSINNNL